MPWYTIKSRDCLSAIALKAGLKDADALYDQPDNSDLRDKRPDPNVVFPGDQVFIPDLAVKEESADTDSRHTFRRSRPPRKCRVRILDVLGNAYADESYVLKNVRTRSPSSRATLSLGSIGPTTKVHS